MELLPRDQIALQRMLDTIRQGYERFGFLPIETPVFENTEVLLTKSGGETEKQVYFVQSTGALQAGKQPELALRFDLTVPLARYVAEHENELAFPFRRYQIQRVYRGERNQRGRFREFYQCDIDVIGKDTLPLQFDAEMPAVISEVFTKLDVGAFTIRLNNRKLLNGYLRAQGVTDPGAWLRELDKFDATKEGGDALMRELSQGKLRDCNDELFNQGRAELDAVMSALDALGVPKGRVKPDYTIARGLDYYTGTVYETFLDAFPQIGSVCSGGRYDNLASAYTKSKLPGVGISIGATRLFYQLKEAGLLKPADSTCKVFVAQMDPELAADARALATELRAAGINTELAPEVAKLKKQFTYADRAGIRYVVLIGGNEKAKGVVQVKDMRGPEGSNQREIPRGVIAAELAR
jgi:histidyl-tRNA synthetase